MSGSDASRSISATFGRNLRAARKARGWTQHELAVALGRGDAMTVSRWERGEHRPTDDYLVSLAHVLELSVADLFREPEAEAA